jgi:catechol 2,3-dioxygenase-like lactoylglutathione lyase family enzyme
MRHRPQPYKHGELLVVIDCADLDRAADFWTDVLGYVRDGPAVGPYLGLFPSGGQGLEILLQRVPERKREKNRLHLDLRTPDFEAEVTRVRSLGAVLVTEQPMEEFGFRWHVLADPDGNEFCVIQPPDSPGPA